MFIALKINKTVLFSSWVPMVNSMWRCPILVSCLHQFTQKLCFEKILSSICDINCSLPSVLQTRVIDLMPEQSQETMQVPTICWYYLSCSVDVYYQHFYEAFFFFQFVSNNVAWEKCLKHAQFQEKKCVKKFGITLWNNKNI